MRVKDILAEAAVSQRDFMKLMNDLGTFMSLNTMKIQTYAKDQASQAELAKMQQQFSKPILNGKKFFDLINDSALMRDPKVVAGLLKWIHSMIGYIEPRIERYVADDKKDMFLQRIETIKNMYRNLVGQS